MPQISSNLLDSIVRKRIFWWRRHDRVPNAGDELARAIVESMLRLKDLTPFANGIFFRRRLFSVGSVIHFARTGDCIWGSGINGKIDSTHYRFKDLDVRAVRGPLSAEILRRRGISVPDTYGDPGLLAPLFFPNMHGAASNVTLYVPHMNQVADKMSRFDVATCSPLCGAGEFISRICRASKVISHSLHGVILAEAYGIPAIRIKDPAGEPDFKYKDYYEGTGRHAVRAASSVEEAIEMETPLIPNIDEIQKRLLASFPYDLWTREGIS